jgi:short-subunit dehydrogenase involved in D-alanine esterification of teichoic acids
VDAVVLALVLHDVLRFVQADASVIITGRLKQKLKEAVEELNQVGHKQKSFIELMMLKE